MDDIRLSLVSHTNAGKTTLARTLLGRDIGEVRDAPHVTEFAESHLLLETPDGDRLLLWDTPGFGDSVRLANRLRASGTPIGWFLSQVWDRWRDRAFWHSQQAVRHVRDDSDVVLYLVNAADPPEAAGYLAPELEILGWIGKPVIALLNQLGPPRADEAAEVAQWQARLSAQPVVRRVLPLDAFARCWVHEGVLLQAVAEVLDDDARRQRMQRLQQAWAARAEARFDAAMQELAASLARTAATRVPLPQAGWRGRRGAADAARQALADALDAEVRASTGRLLALHGLDGSAGREVIERMQSMVDLRQRIGEGRSALVGGVITGALAGLKADVATGGLTLGGGMLAGGLLGALGAAGVARGLNVVRGTDESHAGWQPEAAAPLAEAALLRYLAVAHFGRGRGAWVQSEAPAHWREPVQQAVAQRADALASAWAAATPEAFMPLLRDIGHVVLDRLHPTR